MLGIYACQGGGCPLRRGNGPSRRAFDIIGMRNYSSRHPRGSDVQGNQLDLGNPGLDELILDERGTRMGSLATQHRFFGVAWLVALAAILLIGCTDAPTATTPAAEPAPTNTASPQPTATLEAMVPTSPPEPTAAPAAMEPMETPIGPPWWPSRWGADDEAGASNWITPDKVLESVQLMGSGKVYELGRVYEAGMPLFGQRVFSLRIPGVPTLGPFGSNKLIGNDEYLSTEIGQVGTQFDGLGHIGVQVGEPGDLNEMLYYNGITGAEIASPYGLQKLGIDKLKPIFTRGTLIDVAGFKGQMLDGGEEITLADVQGALERQGLSEDDIEPGDAVLFNTGWGSLWNVDNERYNSGAPGIGLEVAGWLIEKEIVLVGTDTWPVEVFPNPDPDLFAPVHNELLTKNGIFPHENLNLAGLVEDEVYQFAYIFVRVPIKGATGSPGSPIAIGGTEETSTSETQRTPTAEAMEGEDTPIGPPWWPSPWGADDEAGASNWITPAKVMDAAQLIQTGEIHELGRVYEAGMPLFGQRAFSLRIPGSPTGGPFGGNKLVFNDEFVSTEIGQVGTQFDGLGHIGVQIGEPSDRAAMRFYDGVTAAEIAGPYGLQKLGIEKLKPIFTRGILIDVAGFRGQMLDVGEEITLADVQGVLERQGMAEDDIQPGDAVLFNTGWGSLWNVDNERYNSGAPGIGMEVAGWLVEKQIALVAADTWPVEVVPNPDPELAFPVHGELLTKNGIFIHENLNLDGLVEQETYQFAYIFVRVPFKGATGSPGSPIAVQ